MMERKSGLPVLDQGWNPQCCMVIRFLKDFFFPLVYLYSSNYLQHTVGVTACLSWPYFYPFIWLSCAFVANIELHSLSPSPFPCQPLHSGTAGSTRLFCGSLSGSGREERSRDVSLSTEPARLLPQLPQRHGIPRGSRAGLGAVSPCTLLPILRWFSHPWLFLV